MISRDTIRASPKGSPTVAMSGGVVHPVSHGETSRAIQPLGAATKAKPMAIAAWGEARIGASIASARRKPTLPCTTAQKATERPSASAVAVTPVNRERPAAVHTPG